MPARMDPAAAAHLRRLVRGADGAEVFAVGEIASGWITAVSQTCLRSSGSDPELLDPLRPGQVVVHYAPAGGLEPSAADLALGSRLSEVGVGLVLVDAAVAQQRWVIEPAPCSPQPVDDVALEAFFSEGLPSALDGWEARPEQLQLARRVARCLEEQRPLLCEAGTGTGKSLAYLVPAALWARANESRVVVSTFTRTLQSQLQASDLPLLQAGGLRVRTAVLQGRHNYLCRRRLELLRAEPDPGDEEVVEALWRWSEATEGQTRAELEVPSSAELWEQVRSDADLTLSVGCPHYARCHYYQARRAAASAHVVVVNHALLLLDLSIRAETGRGLLPHYTRLIIDEAHHLADSATSVASERLSAPAVRRALSSLVGTRRRRGILSRLVAADPDARRGRAVAVAPDAQRGRAVAVDPDAQRGRAVAVAPDAQRGRAVAAARVAQKISDATPRIGALFERLERATLAGAAQPLRITAGVEASEGWLAEAAPALQQLAGELSALVGAIDPLLGGFAGMQLPPDRVQPLLDLRRVRRRLDRHLGGVTAILDPDPRRCRWLEPAPGPRPGAPPEVALCSAPIEVSGLLRGLLWEPLGGVVCTSATLTVAERFTHWRHAVGLDVGENGAEELVLPSPFDHASQALLGLPRDLPVPEDPRYLEATIEVIVDAVACSDGGAFVLCTSHAAVAAYSEALAASPRLGARPVLAQGTLGRSTLLQRFRDDRRAVLIGTDSFWEGVSVRGEGLRLVILPRLPFRVPTEPLQQARLERIEAQGREPFWEVSLPEAVLKLRQGYGRLIRSHSDRGVVLLLDRRLHDRRYGAIVLRSLPPARRIKGPWRRVRDAMVEVFRG